VNVARGFQGAATANSLVANTQTWQGTLLESGQVRVEFRAVNGSLGVVVANLGVVPRNWSWLGSVASVAGLAPTEYPGADATFQVYGYVCEFNNGCRMHEKGSFHPAWNSGDGFALNSVSGGPNNGQWWISSAWHSMYLVSNVNQFVLPSAPAFTLTDPGNVSMCGGQTQANYYYFNDSCAEYDVDAFITALWAHEDAHMAGGVQSAAVNNPRQEIEGLLSMTSEANLRSMIENALQGVDGAILSDAFNHAHSQTFWQGRDWYWCTSKFCQSVLWSF
jgi:hypothetical protein